MAEIDGAKLRRARELVGFSSTQLSQEVGVSLKYLCDLETGHRKATRNPGLRKRLAEALNVPTSWIERDAVEVVS